MGCDIHIYAEKRMPDGGWQAVDVDRERDWPEFLGGRNYGFFGWLAGVRNYSSIEPLSEPRGIPDDVTTSVRLEYERWAGDAHTPSWYYMEELANFDFDQIMEDRRCERRLANGVIDGGQTCEPGEGEKTTYREFFGEEVIKDILAGKEAGVDRVVFWFDN